MADTATWHSAAQMVTGTAGAANTLYRMHDPGMPSRGAQRKLAEHDAKKKEVRGSP